MTKLEQLHLFLKFHFAPWGSAKSVVAEDELNDYDFSDEEASRICSNIMAGTFVIDDNKAKMLSIVANPPKFANNDVELATRLTAALVEYEADPEAAHVTADEFLVSLVESLGHPAVAETYRKINKW